MVSNGTKFYEQLTHSNCRLKFFEMLKDSYHDGSNLGLPGL